MVGIALENTKLVTVGSVATISGLLIGAMWYRKYIKNKPPTNWMKIGEISDLCIYPVKSFKGIHPSSFECTTMGAKLDFLKDRSFVVIDKDGNFVTGREQPRMTQIVPTVSGTIITFSCPDFPEEIVLDTNDIKGEKKKVKIWWTWTEGIDCGDEVACWLSKCILKEEAGLRMLYCADRENGKEVNDKITSLSKMEDIKLQKDDGGSFADGMSYHLISEASINDLNSRLEGEKVSALNFRPNFIIKGDMLIPFEEDNWKWVKIGDAVFQCLAPCTRCQFTTIDPNTGERSEKMEPLVSLRKYRYIRDADKRKLLTTPAMGIYLGLRSGASVSVGDEVFIPQN